jgi:hypothetical protein
MAVKGVEEKESASASACYMCVRSELGEHRSLMVIQALQKLKKRVYARTFIPRTMSGAVRSAYTRSNEKQYHDW